ncbi:putative 1-aminocyclopropane-1-carboxylate deaminase [Phaeomoniella chlamydospora]|uniref:Putative 1-aminocyclopropane-1-carboxylate deaminase n=1 Tax=Phaeomoniella chlamydospora TaxID=158046 RepID=A0A0G2E9B7_PHACM|nr:putative 1-aminocyclopropane-1-carboxylate deaminase [Phaeomoniella chlamydospora]
MADIELPPVFSSIPRTPLLFGPSPIQQLPRMSADLSSTSGKAVNIYAKRDDCNSGLAFGGNKTRKLEYLIAEAQAQGADTLISVGGIQSNHTRQVAAVSAKFGLNCKLLQEHWVPGDDRPGYADVGNLQLSRLMSADVTIGPPVVSSTEQPQSLKTDGTTSNVFEHKDDKTRLTALMDKTRAEGGTPYWIPAGASDHPLGGLGFARWAFEVAAQEKSLGVFFDTIIVCAVTGSTMAGIVAGFKLLESLSPSAPKRQVVGIDASARPSETRETVLRLTKLTASKIGLDPESLTLDDIILDARYHAGCYGIPDQETIEAIRYGASMEAMITDPVYEGKSLAGMVDMARKGEFKEGSNVLYAHLGGQLACNSYPGILV